MTFSGFTGDTFAFFDELALNNNKPWWEDNKARYERVVRQPLAALMEHLEPEFGVGKLYRPYRDTRFSLDKTPYKDRSAAAVFGQAGTGFYLEVSAAGLDLGGGYWQPGKDQVDKFRDVINDVRLYGDLEATIEEMQELGFDLYQQDALKTAPRGYDADHPRIHLLRLKHMVVEKKVEPADWLYRPEAADWVTEQWRSVAIWNDWLAESVGPSIHGPRPR